VQVAAINAALPIFLDGSRKLIDALSAVSAKHFEAGQLRDFVVGCVSQSEIAGGLIIGELGHIATMMADGSGPIWREEPEVIAPVAVIEAPPKEPMQTVFALKSFKYRDGMRQRFAPQWEDHELSTKLAQKAIRCGCATTTSDDRRRQLRGSRSGHIDPKAIDVVDLDEVELPAEKYIGPDSPDDPVLRAANFQVIPTRDLLLQLAAGRV
jgi:hypothetical protein